ncbi:MAG: hypothetical protein SOT70_01600 [Lachnospiraceae bacterium]|nr:hypothetical protein [Lachnospiraceae bacterium]
MKKKIVFALMLSLILFGSIGVPKVANAKVPYATPWGNMYRDPEFSNSYGRSWYALEARGTHAYIYLEPYYNYGSAASIALDGKGTHRKTSPSGHCKLDINTSSVTGAKFKGNAYGISISQYIKRKG